MLLALGAAVPGTAGAQVRLSEIDTAAVRTPSADTTAVPRTRARPGHVLFFQHVLDASTFQRGAAAGSALRGTMELAFALDLDRVAGVPGAVLHWRQRVHAGDDGSSALGSRQAFANLDAAPFARVVEATVEQRLFGDALRWKAGVMDVNTEFAVTPSAAEFLNASMGISPSIRHAPTYPGAAPALNVFARVTGRLDVAAASYGSTAAQSGRFDVAEANLRWPAVGARLGAGAWQYHARADAQGEASGWYILAESSLPAAFPGGAAFLQYGRSGAGDALLRHFGAGLVLSGPLSAQDRVGLGTTSVLVGREHENAVEAFYAVPLAAWSTAQLDAQRICLVGGTARCALAVTLRFVLTHEVTDSRP